MEKLCELIMNAKSNQESMLELICKFEPLLSKYRRKLFFMDKDDREQTMTLAFIETIHKFKYCENSYACIRFIDRGLYTWYLRLCSKNISKESHEVMTDELKYEEYEEKYMDIDTFLDYETHLRTLPPKYHEIYKMLLLGFSDKEIAEQMNVSKQYINRIKKKICIE